MGKLVIGPEGFVDLRRDPPATTVTVQGFTAEEPAAPPQRVMPEPPAEPPAEALPAIQKTADGLQPSVAAPVQVAVKTRRPALRRIYSSDGHPCYAIVTKGQFTRLAKYKWTGTRSGRMWRRVRTPNQDVVLWLHREAVRCNRADKFVANLDGDERNCCPSNLLVVNTAEEAKAYKRRAIRNAAN